MVKAGTVDPRTGRPSITALAARADVAVETVRKLVYGMGSARTETVERVAAALGVDVRRASRWVGQARAVVEPFVLPAEADLLTARERKALTDLVRAMTADRRSDDRGDTAPTSNVTPLRDRPAEPNWEADRDKFAARRVDPSKRDPALRGDPDE